VALYGCEGAGQLQMAFRCLPTVSVLLWPSSLLISPGCSGSAGWPPDVFGQLWVAPHALAGSRWHTEGLRTASRSRDVNIAVLILQPIVSVIL